MLQLDLNQCDKACLGCVKGYKKKHNLVAGGKFEITCSGIPKTFVSQNLISNLSDDDAKAAASILDPVTWAAETLDWHCLDPDGEIWKRKNPEEYWKWVKNHPDESILGKSRYHRPYQAEMLRCSSQNKVFRIGRQVGKTECLVISILFNMFTKPGKEDDSGFKIILITPYQSQIDLIFTRLDELLRLNEALSNSIRRSVKAPQYTITLYNGSEVKGFTAGTKSGGNADAVRGQHGDMLVFDEADYLNAGDIDSALSIVTNQPNATIWMSSTPTGRREKFYQTCHSKLFREFHYPSQVNPMWDDRLEKTFRENLTEIGYKHEVLAEFGDQEQGVFQNNYIQAAREHYEYGSLPWKKDWIYTIGVDWNDTKIGTTIVVVGFNPSTNTFFVVDRTIVSREGWTQLEACNKIAEYNKIWKPAFIYIDRGFGGTQYEVLRKFGYDSYIDPSKGPNHPDSRLRLILKQYDFGSTIEIHDLFTKQLVKKHAKSFLVENSVRRFETNTIFFAESDKVLEAQLQNYIIERVTQTGQAIYKPRTPEIGDHTLDALMLALVAFTLEKTPFGNPGYRADLAFSGYFGENREKEKEQLPPGSLIIKTDRKPEQEKKNRPSMNRTATMTQQRVLPGINDLPANNTSQGVGIALWEWPGWERDAPRPQSSIKSTHGRPVRKKF